MAPVAWFKMFARNRALFDAVSDETAGQAIKAALKYLDTGEYDNLDAGGSVLFAAMKRDIDECTEEYRITCETNRDNAIKRWQRTKDAKKSTTFSATDPEEAKRRAIQTLAQHLAEHDQ